MKFIKLNLLSVLFFTSFLIAQDDAVEEVVVTGSYIKGSPTDGASPVEIVSRDTIDVLNASTVADITANLTVNSGSENNADSFTAGSTQGTSNVNLRGLGLSSTLVLIDGKRQTIAANTANDGSVFVNTNAIPVIALERVEVLKEGAASIYGSDAIAGVVNYILRRDFTGTEIDVSTQQTDVGNQTDDRFSFIHGRDIGDGNLVVAFSQLDRSPLPGKELPHLAQLAISGFGNSFMVLPYAEDIPLSDYVTTVEEGDYAGSYYILENVPDANCVANKGVLQPQPNSDVGKALGQDLGGTRCGFFYGDRFNIVNDEDHMSAYLSYSQTLGNGVDFSIDYMKTSIDVNDNPQSPSYPALSYLSPAKAIAPGVAGSPFAYPVLWVGRPLGSTAPSPHAPRDIDTDRTSVSFSGTLDAGYDWTVSYTTSNDSLYALQPDVSTSKFDAAIAGEGGVSGTESWNLFDPTANSASLIDHISSAQVGWQDASLSVLDIVLTGSKNGFDFAGGFQHKKEEYTFLRDENSLVEIENGSLAKPADLMFLGGGLNSDASRNSIAMFAEVSKDVSDKLEVKAALRYEDLESDTSVNPKLSVRYEASDNLVLRGSVSSSFREPSLAQLSATVVSLQAVQDYDPETGEEVGNPSFIRVVQAASPDLEPEEATNMNFGAIWTINDNLSMKVDYWNIDYSDLITIENSSGKVKADPLGDDVIRVLGTLVGVNTKYFNASSVDTDGYDLEIGYNRDTKYGQLKVGLNRVHTLSYRIPLQTGETADVVGKFNYGNFARSLPDVKSVLSASLVNGNHKVSAFVRKTSSYATTRGFGSGVGPIAAARGFTSKIDSHTTVDVNYSFDTEIANNSVVISAGVKNLFDEDVPLVYDSVNFSYDPKHHDPRGRIMYIGARVSL
jgi:iron complex outermembrane receptor protein